MRKTLLFLLLLPVKLLLAQVNDDFSDGNFTADPVWTGQTNFFTVNAQRQLKTLPAAVAQTVTLRTANALATNVRWEFTVQLNFDPSATNFTRIYLMSDQEDLNGPLNGYFIQIGESGATDSYDLYRQSGNTLLKIIDGPPKTRVNANFLSTKLRILRTIEGEWELYASPPNADEFVAEGRTIDNTYTRTAWFGLYCRYTATRADGFAFSDFSVRPLFADLTKPKLLHLQVTTPTSMQATFSEPLDAQTALAVPHYRILELDQQPIRISGTATPEIYLLHFAQPFATGRYTLQVNGIADLAGNLIDAGSTRSTFYILPQRAKKGEVVINEIMADPSPPAGLPEAEYVELWNTTDRYILLQGWTYGDLSTTLTLKTDTLAPYAYLILCARADTAKFQPYGSTSGLSPWPALNNDKDRLRLHNAEGDQIDEVYYADTWYRDAEKRKGGFSLELIDPQSRCTGRQNWQASAAANGGSPGQVNSVYQLQLQYQPLQALELVPLSDTVIKVVFSGSVDSLAAVTPQHYRFNNGAALPTRVSVAAPDFTSVLLHFTRPLTRGISYTLSLGPVSDCAGNVVAPASRSFFRARPITAGAILISEIMVNPRPGGVDYIELYNASEHPLDLADLKIANGSTASARAISSKPLLLESNSYWVLCRNRQPVSDQYTVAEPGQLVELTNLPAFAIEKGTVILWSDSVVIDRFDYREAMHFGLLNSSKGVALERVSFARAANAEGNFKSAVQTTGFGTPTAKNSQAQLPAAKISAWLEQRVFSPDGDGLADELRILLDLDDHDFVATVTIFDAQGRLVRRLLRNGTVPAKGTLVWNGLRDNGARCAVGLYHIRIDVFNLEGRKKQLMLIAGLAMRK